MYVAGIVARSLPRESVNVLDAVSCVQAWLVVYCDGATDEMTQDELKESVRPRSCTSPCARYTSRSFSNPSRAARCA